jgi:hypothetical protein
MFVIESDATIVVPLMLTALIECSKNPGEANALIKRLMPRTWIAERRVPGQSPYRLP